MTHGTTRAHIARALFAAIACQSADVFAAMESDISRSLATLRADGGASGNPFLMQLQAAILVRPACKARKAESGDRHATRPRAVARAGITS